MSNRYPPLKPLAENDGDPRAAFAASLLSVLKVPPSLAPSVSARIELQLRRSPPRPGWRDRLESSRGLRALRAVAVVAGILLSLGGSAFAAYRAPEIASAVKRALSQAAERWAHSWKRSPQAGSEAANVQMVSERGIEEAPPAPVLPQLARPEPVPEVAGPSLAPKRHSPRPPAPTISVATISHAPDELALGASALGRGLAEKRRGNLEQADEIFRSYRADHPNGPLATEAALDQLDAALTLGRRSEALGLLELLCQDRASPRWNELRVLRAEVQQQLGQCDRALPTFDDSFSAPSLSERALYGRATCLQTLGRMGEGRHAFEDLVARYPSGALAARAREALGHPR